MPIFILWWVWQRMEDEGCAIVCISVLIYVSFFIDAFKREFKRFKKPSDDDMKTAVIDFENPDAFIAQVLTCILWPGDIYITSVVQSIIWYRAGWFVLRMPPCMIAVCQVLIIYLADCPC